MSSSSNPHCVIQPWYRPVPVSTVPPRESPQGKPCASSSDFVCLPCAAHTGYIVSETPVPLGPATMLYTPSFVTPANSKVQASVDFGGIPASARLANHKLEREYLRCAGSASLAKSRLISKRIPDLPQATGQATGHVISNLLASTQGVGYHGELRWNLNL